MNINVILEAGGEGGFKACVPGLPRCFSRGYNEEEALMNIRRSILFHLGIEEVVHPKNRIDLSHYKCMLTQMMESKMSKEKKLATITTFTGLFLMIAVIWTAWLFA